MKLLVYAHRLEVGGTQVNAIELAAALRDAHGFDVVLFAQAGPMVALVREKRLRYVPAPDARFHPSPARMRALRDLVRHERPDLLHVWDWWQCLDAFYAVQLPFRVPMVVTDMMMEFTRVLPRHVPTTFGVPALTDMALGSGYRRAVSLVPPVDIVANAPEAVDAREFRKHLSISDGEIVLVTVSRLSEWMKADGLVRSIEAVEALGSALPVRLVIVGDGAIRPRLQQRADQVNAALGREAVTLTGYMLDPRPAYAAADVVIGMGGSALRGMAFAKPTVVVGTGGFAAIFSPSMRDWFHRYGFYGEGRTDGVVDTLVDHIRVLACDAGRRRELGAFSRQYVVETYSLEHNAARLAEFCRAAAAAKPRIPHLLADAIRTSTIYLRERRFRRASREELINPPPSTTNSHVLHAE